MLQESLGEIGITLVGPHTSLRKSRPCANVGCVAQLEVFLSEHQSCLKRLTPRVSSVRIDDRIYANQLELTCVRNADHNQASLAATATMSSLI